MVTLREYAMELVGLPYIWGGDDPMLGFDCSGLVQELLISCGAHPNPKVDHTAQMLFDYFNVHGSWNKHVLGSLAFYGASASKVTHVAMLLDQYRIIEAGGGGSATTTAAVAAKQNAFVRIRLIKARGDLVAVIKPSYAAIGYV